MNRFRATCRLLPLLLPARAITAAGFDAALPPTDKRANRIAGQETGQARRWRAGRRLPGEEIDRLARTRRERCSAAVGEKMCVSSRLATCSRRSSRHWGCKAFVLRGVKSVLSSMV